MNSGLLFVLSLVAAPVVLFLLGLLVNSVSRARKYDRMKPEFDKLPSLNAALEQREKDLQAKTAYDKQVIEHLAREKAKGFPWLAKAYADFDELKDRALSDSLRYKRHPAPRSAEIVRQISKERREAETAAREARYLLDYCMGLAPWLEDYIGVEASELDSAIKEIHSAWEKKEEDFDEEVKHHYGPKYQTFTPAERLQKKLDWWWEKPNKTNWQLGREYERYIGYLYESKQWDVYYHGKKGLEDLGRDLICKRGRDVDIIQCKRWARQKEIHEKHIYYLFGTTVEYYLEHFGNERSVQLALFPNMIQDKNLFPKLITTASVSAKARQAATMLGVDIVVTPFDRFPSVKCNISRRTGEKIYHLPFDQQYDSILIEEERLERYVSTVAEAEAMGFRHAYRWRGNVESTLP